MSDSMIVERFPTKVLMEFAKQNNKMVFSFMFKPDSVINKATADAFQEGWLEGLGLEPNCRLVLVLVPKGLDMESVIKSYLENLENMAEISLKNFGIKYV